MTADANADIAYRRTHSNVHLDRLHAAVADLVLGLLQWRVWWILAYSDMRQRYRRSSLGQFWLTISMAATIGGIGIIYAFILRQPLDRYLPYLGVGLIMWTLLSGLVNNLATCFINAELHLQSYPTPRSAIIYRTIARDFLISAHNFLLVPILIVLFGVPIRWSMLLVLPGLVLIALNAVWIGMLIGGLCTRFRDLPQMITNVVQLAFFVTPVLFHSDQLHDRMWFIVALNPFASFLEIVRAPLLGEVPHIHHYLMVALCTVTGWIAGLAFFARFRSRIVYWL